MALRLNSSSTIASMPVTMTGMYSGRQPAMTALRATFSAVMGIAPTGTMPTVSSGFRFDGVEKLGEVVGGGRYYGQAVGEALVEVKLDGFKVVESLMGVGCQAVLPPHTHGSAEEIITLGGGGAEADARIAK